MYSPPLFFFFAHTACTIFTFNIFIIFCLTPSKKYNGFFLFLGFGYFCVGCFLIVERCITIGIIGGKNEKEQSWVASRFLEVISFFGAIAFSKREFNQRGFYVTVLMFTSALVFFLASIFWFHIFPNAWDPITAQHTAFRIQCEGIIVSSFIIIGGLVISRRNVFGLEVFPSLMVGVGFRVCCSLFHAKSINDDPVYHFLTILLKAVSFAFMFISVGIRVLRRPFQNLSQDLQAHHSALESEKMFAEFIVEQVPTLMMVLDKTGKIIHANKFATDCLRSSKRELEGREFLTMFPTEYLQLPITEETEMKIKDLRFCSTYKMNNGEEKVIEWALNILNTSSFRKKTRDTLEDRIRYMDKEIAQALILCLGQDITEKAKREALLTQARNEAEEIAKMKDMFVANVSHELRTPLNCIVGVATLLQNMQLTAMQKEMIDMMYTASTSMIDVIGDLLDISSMQQGKLKTVFASVNLRKSLEDVLVSMSISPQAQQKPSLEFGYLLENNCPHEIFTDEKRLRQVLVNLLSNSIKYTHSGHVTIKVSKKQDKIEFRVQDTGTGISPENLDKLFDRFEMMHYEVGSQQSTGLGLPICKQLVTILGGEIGVESTIGKGSTFWFVLPMNPPGQPLQTVTEAKFEFPFSVSKRQGLFIALCMDSDEISSIVASALEDDFKTKVALTHNEAELGQFFDTIMNQENTDVSELALIIETEKLGKIELRTLQSVAKKFKIRIIAVARTFSTLIHQDFSYLPAKVDVIGKPIKLSLLRSLLLTSETSAKETAPKFEKDAEKKLNKILVVEDNAVNSRVMSMMLNKLGFQFDVAQNGVEALEYFKKNIYDVVLMDCFMPVMDGYTATVEIRNFERQENKKPTPIIALTANAMETERHKCKIAGMNDFLSKPIELEVLKQTLAFYDRKEPV